MGENPPHFIQSRLSAKSVKTDAPVNSKLDIIRKAYLCFQDVFDNVFLIQN